MGRAATPLPEDLLQYYPGQAQDHGQHAPPGFLGVPPAPAPPVAVEEVPVATDSGSTGGWLGGLFGRKQQQDNKIDRKSEVLEMDLPPSAIPSFD